MPFSIRSIAPFCEGKDALGKNRLASVDLGAGALDHAAFTEQSQRLRAEGIEAHHLLHPLLADAERHVEFLGFPEMAKDVRFAKFLVEKIA